MHQPRDHGSRSGCQRLVYQEGGKTFTQRQFLSKEKFFKARIIIICITANESPNKGNYGPAVGSPFIRPLPLRHIRQLAPPRSQGVSGLGGGGVPGLPPPPSVAVKHSRPSLGTLWLSARQFLHKFKNSGILLSHIPRISLFKSYFYFHLFNK